MKILLVDDEAPARQRLRRLVDELDGGYQVVGEAVDGEQAVAMCEADEIDLVLMDIRMPRMDGLEAALALAELPTPPAVIFTTAYDEHALAAFDANAVDYLLKPVRGERLARALEKAQRLSREQLDGLRPEAGREGGHIVASYRGNLQRVPVEDVYFLKADSKYVVVRHAGGELLVEDSLRTLEERFPDRWLRIHRNALVDPGRISSLSRRGDGQYLVEFGDIDTSLEVSRRHLSAVKRWFRGSD